MKRSGLLPFLSILIFSFPASHAASTSDETYKKLEVFAKVLGYIEDNYIEKVDTKKLMDDALNGITSSLDPHTSYLSAELYRQMKVDTSGEYGGVGLELGFNDNKELIVVTPTEDGPAIKMGVRTGDRILEVNGKSTQGWTLFEAAKQLRGARGSTVRILLLHKDETVPFEVKIKRETMHIDSVESRMLNDDTGYIQVKTFQEKTDEEVRRAYERLQTLASKNKKKLEGVVLDLRNNPGGLLDQAISVADLFLEEGVIVSTRGRDNKMQNEAKARAEGTLPATPLVTIINGGTASAAEIVAGALQDLGRSPLIGTPSFGKGSVQNIIDLEDGSALKITIARYYTPKGRPIQNVGNQPNIYVSPMMPVSQDSDGPREKDLKGSISTEEAEPSKPAKTKSKNIAPEIDDPQLKFALDYLRSSRKFK